MSIHSHPVRIRRPVKVTTSNQPVISKFWPGEPIGMEENVTPAPHVIGCIARKVTSSVREKLLTASSSRAIATEGRSIVGQQHLPLPVHHPPSVYPFVDVLQAGEAKRFLKSCGFNERLAASSPFSTLALSV